MNNEGRSTVWHRRGVYLFIFMHAKKRMCMHTRTHMHLWDCTCVSLLACLGFHNSRVQDTPTN